MDRPHSESEQAFVQRFEGHDLRRLLRDLRLPSEP
jgi:hypothetical protein